MNIQTIANSGQCFRFNEVAPCEYELISQGHILCISVNCHGEPILMQPWNSYWVNYFGENINIDNPDTFLRQAILHSPGLHILRQDPWETLVSFIISQRKNIPAIKNSIERLCKIYGNPIDTTHYAFPSPHQLLYLDKDSCGLGYRLDYIKQLSKGVVDGQINLETIQSMDYDSAKKTLLKIKGVGEKVANCALLFGFGFDNAFPIDVHVQRVLKEHYPNGFPYKKYDGHLGLVQQYLFEYQRFLGKGGYKIDSH